MRHDYKKTPVASRFRGTGVLSYDGRVWENSTDLIL